MTEIEEEAGASQSYDRNVVTRKIAPLLISIFGLAAIILEPVLTWMHVWGGESPVEKEILKAVTALAAIVIIAMLSLAVRDIGKSLSRLETDFSSADRYLRGGLPVLVSGQQTLQKEIRATQVETEALRDLRRIYRKAETERLKRMHILSAVRVLEAMHTHNLKVNFGDIKLFNDGRNEASISDFSVAFSLLKEIEKELPDGSVWFGVTHLTNPFLWSERRESTDFHEYRTHMWQRAKGDKLTVFRIYCFQKGTRHRAEFEKVLSQEHDSHVKVKIIEGDPGDFPDDMSLLWAPNPDESLTGLPPVVEVGDLNTSLNIRDMMKTHKRIPVCGLWFHVKNRDHLNSVTIHDPESKDFRTLCNQFKDAWDNKAHDYDPEQWQREADAKP